MNIFLRICLRSGILFLFQSCVMFTLFSDIDECDLGSHDCSAQNSECRNNPGSFRCECIDGYIEDMDGNCIGKKI